MCGICGAINWHDPRGAESALERMIPTMRHRGPDDEGRLVDANLAIGMRRLSIIDVEGGHQPVFNRDGSIGVVFNGEIYNFQEVQTALKELGHEFRTRSDSEVIAHAYEEWGVDCVERLRGMFAFAIYDRRTAATDDGRSVNAQKQTSHEMHPPSQQANSRGQLFLARDRFGIKPLYYFQNENIFLFASEVRTLLASHLVPRNISQSALQSYLLFGSVSEPESLIDGVVSLPPGHRLLIPLDAQPDELKPEQYWTLAQDAHNKTNGNGFAANPTNAVVRVRELLEESVRLHMIADVPIGVFLSSGIDSTALAALASREFSGVHTFTVAFPEGDFNEAELAARTAQKFGTTHQELMLTSDDMLSRLDEAVAALDQPSVDGINTYFVSWAARAAGLKVALSGLGGDEVFGGYRTFNLTPRFERIAALGEMFPQRLRDVMAAGGINVGGRLRSQDAARKLAALWSDAASLPHPYFFSRALFAPTQVKQLMLNRRHALNEQAWWTWLADGVAASQGMDRFGTVTSLEARSYLVNTLLRDADSMSMASSLEVRVPFLDHLLVEFVARLPEAMKRQKNISKALLVESLKDLLPNEVVHQTKRGFTFPWQQWLRGGLKATMEAGLNELAPSLRPLLDATMTRQVWNDFLDGRTNWTRPWSLYVLNEWTKRNVEG